MRISYDSDEWTMTTIDYLIPRNKLKYPWTCDFIYDHGISLKSLPMQGLPLWTLRKTLRKYFNGLNKLIKESK